MNKSKRHMPPNSPSAVMQVPSSVYSSDLKMAADRSPETLPDSQRRHGVTSQKKDLQNHFCENLKSY
jgi:hypothetical protein